MKIELISINSIKLRRSRRPATDLEDLKKSIVEIGLLHPITVTSDLYLIAGWRRLEAHRALGFPMIPVIRKTLDELQSELAELDENLMRREFSVLERSELLARRKTLYEELHPETRPRIAQAVGMNRSIGNNVAAESAVTFAMEAARQTGQSVRAVRVDLQIANRIPDEVKDVIRETPIADKKGELLALARLEPTTQARVAERVAENPRLEVRQAVKEIERPAKETTPQERFNERRESTRVICNELLRVRQKTELLPESEVALNSITELIAELRDFAETTEDVWRERVKKAIGENECNTYEDIKDELDAGTRIRFPVSVVKKIVKELVAEGAAYTTPRYVVGRPKPMGTLIFLK